MIDELEARSRRDYERRLAAWNEARRWTIGDALIVGIPVLAVVVLFTALTRHGG